MSTEVKRKTVTVALLGNPNTGKSTLFNALSGIRQRVGNYPGVTVEKKIGRVDIDGQQFALVDLPGTYSLAPRSPDEMVAVDVLLGRRDDVAPPDIILCIVDASNLERNLYLVSQVLEMGRPVVIALNMIDVAMDREINIDVDRLRKQLGVTVVKTQANRKSGLPELKDALTDAIDKEFTAPVSPFPEVFQREVAKLESSRHFKSGDRLPRYLVERFLLDTGGYLESTDLFGKARELLDEVSAARGRLSEAGFPVPAVEAMARYDWIAKVLQGVVSRPTKHRVSVTDRIDKILTHKFWGTLTFIVVMVLMFQAIFAWAAPMMDGIEWLVGIVGNFVASSMQEGALRSLLVNGVIGGVGGVLVFLPQIFILFLFIAILEDCGYMARAAYLVDNLMSRIGLSGKSFIPLLSSFACAIPGIMGARVIENRRDRLVTILIAPLMSCSARLPVYVLLIAAFIPNQMYMGGWIGLQGITMFAMYSIGIVTAIVVAWLLKKTLLKGETPPFVMELPSYKIPSLGTVFWRMSERGWSFVRRAGTLILAVTVIVWAAAYFPHGDSVETDVRAIYKNEVSRLETNVARFSNLDVTGDGTNESHAKAQEELDELNQKIDNEVAGAYIEQSLLGRAGHFVEPVVRPLGWDWKIGCAAIASFPAREVVIGTLGVIYNLGDEQDEESQPLRKTLKAAKWKGTDRPVFNVPVALSIMVFFALCAQCAATLVVMRRETASWRWPIFTFVYMTTLAYLGAMATYQIAILFIA